MFTWAKSAVFWVVLVVIVGLSLIAYALKGDLLTTTKNLGAAEEQTRVAETTTKAVVADTEIKEKVDLDLQTKNQASEDAYYELKRIANENFSKALREPEQEPEPVPTLSKPSTPVNVTVPLPRPVAPIPKGQVMANPKVVDVALDTMWSAYCQAQPTDKECVK